MAGREQAVRVNLGNGLKTLDQSKMNETIKSQKAATTTHQQAHLSRVKRVSAKWLRFSKPVRADQDGATTGEFIFWTVLALGVLVIALVSFSKGNASTDAQSLVKDFNAMSNDASTLYTGNWAQFTTANADNAGIFKNYSAFTDNGGGSVSVKPGGGLITVAPGTLVTANDSGQYTVPQLTFEGCKGFAAGVQKNAGSVSVNGVVAKAYGGIYQPQLAQCKDSGNTVIVTRS